MTTNILKMEELLDRHFKRSKNSVLEVGIFYKGTETFYNINQNKNSLDDFAFGQGSISKTFIGSYIANLNHLGKIKLNDSIDQYLSLNSKITYPTVLDLLTHASGYSAFIPATKTISSMLFNGFNKRNIYHNTPKEWLQIYLKKHKPKKNKKYRYSDFNYAILAQIIEKIEKDTFQNIIQKYVKEDIGLTNTYYGNYKKTKNNKYSWTWEDNNAFLASGGLFSTTSDMLNYLKYQIDPKNSYLDVSHEKYIKMNRNHIFSSFSWNSFYNGSFFWHIGGQGNYRSYALFDKKRNIAIIINSIVNINTIHVNRLGSNLYRNVKRNHQLILSFLENYVETQKN